MTNSLSLSNVADEHRVALDASEEKALQVCFPREIVKFKELINRLWGIIPRDGSFYK